MCDLKQQPKITQDNVHLLLPSKVAQLANRLLQNGGLKIWCLPSIWFTPHLYTRSWNKKRPSIGGWG